jgi:hypothetical protein
MRMSRSEAVYAYPWMPRDLLHLRQAHSRSSSPFAHVISRYRKASKPEATRGARGQSSPRRADLTRQLAGCAREGPDGSCEGIVVADVSGKTTLASPPPRPKRREGGRRTPRQGTTTRLLLRGRFPDPTRPRRTSDSASSMTHAGLAGSIMRTVLATAADTVRAMARLSLLSLPAASMRLVCSGTSEWVIASTAQIGRIGSRVPGTE